MVIDEEFTNYEGSSERTTFRGIRDVNLFNSALYEPKQTFDKQELYPDILSKAACYLRSFSKNHPFFDGNKRTALVSTIVFLESNGYEVTASNDKMFKLVENVVKFNLSIASIKKRLKKFTKELLKRKRALTIKDFLSDLVDKVNKD